jgi:muramoyltetrapeptide carboxypeptidase
MSKPRALEKGDVIGIAASASPFDRNEFKKGIRVLKEMGFEVYHRDDIFDQTRYLAGTDKRRADELMELFASTKIKAILFARGGYGSQRIIPLLDRNLLVKHKKPIVGFSDVTALLTFLRQEFSMPTFYGPVITTLGKDCGPLTKDSLLSALTAKEAVRELPAGNAVSLRGGRASGPLVGGCLSLINSSIGTPYELETKGCVLFIEEVGEKVYVLDRMLTQLKNAGKMNDVAGVVFGSIVLREGEEYDVKTMIMDVLNDFEGPIVMDYPAGHTNDFVTLPLGAEVALECGPDERPRLQLKTGLLS